MINRIATSVSNRFYNKILSFAFSNIKPNTKANLPFQDQNAHTTILEPILKSKEIPTYRLIDLQGKLLEGSPTIDSALLNRIYQKMIYVEEMDTILLKAKGQGLISFYMTSFGQTACTIGTGAGLQDQDLIFPQYRQQGTFVWRGLTISEIVNQCMGNCKDGAKGRQMPVHYGSPKLNIITVSSPLTTQVPQASGAGYGFRTSNEDRVAVTFFGEGAASQGDFHSAMNFAETLNCQTLFLCRNNHYAISTHSSEQYKSKGIISRAIGYGMASLKVDGNDALAVYSAVRYARDWIVKNKRPFFIEFITYRIGDHSTSDNSALYREDSQKQSWAKFNNPIKRLKAYLQNYNIKQRTTEQDQQFRKKVRQQVIDTLRESGKHKLPRIQDLFTDVYSQMTENLKQQKRQLQQHIHKNADRYNLDKFDA